MTPPPASRLCSIAAPWAEPAGAAKKHSNKTLIFSRSKEAREVSAMLDLARIIVAAALTTLCLWPMLAPAAKAQEEPAAAEATAALDLTARGAWSPSAHYVKDDIVTSRGSAWRAKRANTNKVPGSTSPSTALDWERFAAGFNPLGAWVNTKTYHSNDLVSHVGSTWRARRTPTDWQQFAAKGATGPAGPSSVGTGSAGAPSFSFTGDSDTGIFSPSPGKIALAEDGALFLHNIGSGTTALGANALNSNSGVNNTAMGSGALADNAGGGSNTAVGAFALQANSSGSNNTAMGESALAANTSGINSTAVGSLALTGSTGNHNTAMGHSALLANNIGESNTAIGAFALDANTFGNSNTAIGSNALGANTTGVNNIALGSGAGLFVATGNSNIFIGNQGVNGDTATIKIGTQATQTKTFIAGIGGTAISADNDATVLIDTVTGQLGTQLSSRRYKEDIQPMADASAALLKLRPVTFRYKQPYADGGKPIQYGLIAEEVAEVLPDLAVFNKDGTPETVKYHLLPSLLLNEYQGQQKTIQRQDKSINSQAEQIAAQAAEITALRQQMSRIEAMLARPGRAAGGSPRAVSLVGENYR
jgi:hypothetical protein